MKIKYTQNETGKQHMYEYIRMLLEELPSDIQATVNTSASLYIFNKNPESKDLRKEQGKLFRRLVAKLLYLNKRTRQDIQTAYYELV